MTTPARATTLPKSPLPATLGPALPRRRRAGLVALGIILVVVGAVVAYLVAVTIGVSRPYLALARDVSYGATVTTGDLTTVNLNPAAGLSLVPAADVGMVVGQHATTDLYAGSPLSHRDVAAVTIPAPGQQVLAIELKPGQVPGVVHAGTAVLLAIVPSSGSDLTPDPQNSATSTTPTIEATVVAGPVTGADRSVRIDVAVAASEAPAVATMAAAGRIALIVTGRG